MRLVDAQNLVRNLINTHVGMVDDASAEALRNAEQDLLLLIEDIIKQCRDGIDLDGALTDAERLTREGR